MQKAILIWLFICLFTEKTPAQNIRIDSLTSLLNNALSDRERAFLYLSGNKSFPIGEAEKVFLDAQNALPLFQKVNDSKGVIESMIQMADSLSRQNKFEEALEISRSANVLATETGYLSGKAMALSNIGLNLTQLGNLLEAENAYLEAVGLMIQTGNEKDLCEIYNRLGVLNFKSGKYYRAMEYLDSGIAIAERHRLEISLSNLLMNKGNNLTELGQYEEALHLHLKSAELKEKLEDYRGLIQSYNNIGNLLKQVGKLHEALEYYRKSIQLAQEQKNLSSLALGYSNLAIVMDVLKQRDSVPFFFEKAIEYFTQTAEKGGLAMALHNLGNFYFQQNQLQEAETFLTKALHIRKEINAPYPIASTLHVLGKIVMKKNNLLKAEKLLLEALFLIETENGLKKVEILQTLSDFYKQKGDYQSALTFKESSSNLRDTILNESELVNLEKTRAAFEMAKKDAEIIIEKKQNEIHLLTLKQQRLQLIIFVVVSLLLAGLVIALIWAHVLMRRSYQLIKQKNKTIELLAQEVHHRAKNNLQIISGILSLQSRENIDQNSVKAIDESRTRLDSIALIHQQLYNSQNLSSIQIKHFIEELARLLDQSFGNGNNIQVSIDHLQNSHLNLDQAIPIGLIINELVTNAFKHAVRNNPDEFLILIALKNHLKGKLELSVSDNGLSRQAITENSDKTSFGLKLVATLVKQLNGTLNYSFENGTTFRIEFSVL